MSETEALRGMDDPLPSGFLSQMRSPWCFSGASGAACLESVKDKVLSRNRMFWRSSSQGPAGGAACIGSLDREHCVSETEDSSLK